MKEVCSCGASFEVEPDQRVGRTDESGAFKSMSALALIDEWRNRHEMTCSIGKLIAKASKAPNGY